MVCAETDWAALFVLETKNMLAETKKISVKFLTRISRNGTPDIWARQFPGAQPVWGNCRFIFDPDERNYDWLVAYEDLPKESGSKSGQELLACPSQHTLLVTTEPSSIKHYGKRFVSQFGVVLTSQDERSLPHPGAVRSQPGLFWYYGLSGRSVSFDELVNNPPLIKSRLISTVTSSKKQRQTLHRRRHQFAGDLKALLPELDLFGRGVRPVEDKAEGMRDYRYHVALENFVGRHHWTEKLADSFLACALPFYFGCPNATDYFPKGSFIPIDMFDSRGAARVIRNAIDSGEYERRLPLILEARRRILYEYNLFAVLSNLIEQRHSGAAMTPGLNLYSRHALRNESLGNFLESGWEKITSRLATLRHSR